MAMLASSASPLQAAEDELVAQLIQDLNKPEKAARVAKILVSLGDRALTPLFAEAVEGAVLPRRGWAIVCLAEIGGPQVAEWLTRLQAEERQPPLVRTWAAAGRVQMAKSVAAVASLADSLEEFPALRRPIGKRIVALMQSDANARAIDLLRLSLTPSLRPVLSPAILQIEPKELVRIMATAKNTDVRRMAAGYLATVAGTRAAEVSREVRAVYKYKVEAVRVPWEGGALFIPAMKWSASDARELAGQLIRWLVFCDRRQLTGEMRQLHNNLRSLSLARAAGYQSPGFRQVGVEEWLQAWGRAVGRDPVKKILAEQGVAKQEKYQKALDALPAQ